MKREPTPDSSQSENHAIVSDVCDDDELDDVGFTFLPARLEKPTRPNCVVFVENLGGVESYAIGMFCDQSRTMSTTLALIIPRTINAICDYYNNMFLITTYLLLLLKWNTVLVINIL